MPLSPQHERFCREYAVDLNGSAAYRRVYPKVKTEHAARTNASRLLARADVQARVAELQREKIAETDLSARRVLRELSLIAFGSLKSAFREDGSLKAPHEWDDATAALLAGVETEEERVVEGDQGFEVTTVARTHKVKLWDKLRALELLCKHLGLLKEDAPHPDRPKFDVSKLTDVQKSHFLTAARLALGAVAG